MSELIVEARDLCCKLGKQYLLNHIDWKVYKGEHWAIFGTNGSGKTTLLSMIAGFKSPTFGTLTVLGQEYNEENIFELRRQVGWVSSSFFDRYLKNETVLQIVLSGLTGSFNITYEISDADVRKAKKLLCELRLSGKENRVFNTLSKGERQNVLVARALITGPRILVLDEPCTGLDVYAREHTLNTIKSIAESNSATVLYVTHYPEEILPFMNKTMLLKNGRVFAKGDTEKIMVAETLSALLDESVTVTSNTDGTRSIHINMVSNIQEICYRRRVT